MRYVFMLENDKDLERLFECLSRFIVIGKKINPPKKETVGI